MLHHNAPHYTILQHTATPCNTLQHTTTHCNMLHENLPVKGKENFEIAREPLVPFNANCITLQHTATHGNTLQHTATRCTNIYLSKVKRTWRLRVNPLFHSMLIASHCNTLQHTTTHCNTLHEHLPVKGKENLEITREPLVPFNANCITLQHTATHCNTLQHAARISTCQR